MTGIPGDRAALLVARPPKPALIATGIAIVYGALITLWGAGEVAWAAMAPLSVGTAFIGRAFLAIGVLLLLGGPNLALGSRAAAAFVAAAGVAGFVFGLLVWLANPGDEISTILGLGVVLGCGVATLGAVASRRYFTTWGLPGPWPEAEWAVVVAVVTFTFVPLLG